MRWQAPRTWSHGYQFSFISGFLVHLLLAFLLGLKLDERLKVFSDSEALFHGKCRHTMLQNDERWTQHDVNWRKSMLIHTNWRKIDATFTWFISIVRGSPYYWVPWNTSPSKIRTKIYNKIIFSTLFQISSFFPRTIFSVFFVAPFFLPNFFAFFLKNGPGGIQKRQNQQRHEKSVRLDQFSGPDLSRRPVSWKFCQKMTIFGWFLLVWFFPVSTFFHGISDQRTK